MKRLLAFVIFFAAVSAFAHAGHIHTYMGSVTMMHGNSAFMITTAEGRDVVVKTTDKTTFTDADDHPAKFSDVTVGKRVVVKMNEDGQTAASVKIAAEK